MKATGSTTDANVSYTTLASQNGTSVRVCNHGARVTSWIFKGVQIVVGFDSLDEYMKSGELYYGATIGRYANRIARGRFSLNGRLHQLPVNNTPNHLHGGEHGFHNVTWRVEDAGADHIAMRYVSKDGEEGYPGNLEVVVSYTLSAEDELLIEYFAKTDAPTVINLTHHSYFNLNGHGNGDISGHQLFINADRYTPVNEDLVPTGDFAPVTATPFDFTIAKSIGKEINTGHEQLVFGRGYDHNFVLNPSEDGFAARAVGEKTGIMLEVFTDQPGMQFYTGNFMTGRNITRDNHRDEYRSAFCLETQHFPDSPNQPSFPSTVLRPGEAFHSLTRYKVSAI